MSDHCNCPETNWMDGKGHDLGCPLAMPTEPPASEPPANLCTVCGQIKEHQNHWAPFGWHYFESAPPIESFEQKIARLESELRQAASSHTELRARLEAVVIKISHERRTVWKDGIECEICWPHCGRCALEAALGDHE
jgi:hypothetical protein